MLVLQAGAFRSGMDLVVRHDGIGNDRANIPKSDRSKAQDYRPMTSAIHDGRFETDLRGFALQDAIDAAVEVLKHGPPGRGAGTAGKVRRWGDDGGSARSE